MDRMMTGTEGKFYVKEICREEGLLGNIQNINIEE
jgi:hypothetical protein